MNDGKTLVGKKTPAKEGPITKLAYDGNKWMIKVADKTIATGTINIDATKTPKQIDVLDKSGMKMTRRGSASTKWRYKLQGSKARKLLCWNSWKIN